MTAAALRARFDAAEDFDGWQSPDMSILAAGRTSPPSMPAEMFGRLWPLVQDLAAGAGSPVDYVGMGVLGVAASLIGGKRRVQPFASAPQWADPCILWLSLVGDPSCGKSPAIDAATAPLRSMEADLAEGHRATLLSFQTVAERARAERAEWQAQVKTATKDGVATPAMPADAEDPDEPRRPRLMVQDTTPEALCEILAGNPDGTLCLRDELSAWLMSFERYSPGGREFWLEAYGGRPHVIDRKGSKKPLTIPFNGVSVVGGIQPEKLAEGLLATADDGLVPRFLWAWPDPIPYSRPRNVADAGRLERVYRRLAGIEFDRDQNGQTSRTLLLDDAAGDIFEGWIAENDAGVGDAASLYKSFVGKLRGAVLRLSLVVEYLAWADTNAAQEPTTISDASLVTVIDFIEGYAKPTALRVFGDAALPQSERNAALLARWIQRTKVRTINATDVRRKSGIATLKVAADVDAAIEALVEAEWLRAASTRDGDTPGRGKKNFTVNPAVHGGARG